MFYFQQLMNTAMGGIDATSIIPTVTNIAFAILLVGFLIGLYQAALRGGDLQALAVTAIKYLVVAMIIANWASVFRDVNGSFNAVANFIGSSSGASDMFLNWMTQLQQQAANNPGLTFWDLINGDAAGTITVLLLWSPMCCTRWPSSCSASSTCCLARCYTSSGLWCWRSFQYPASANWGRPMPSM